MYFPKSQITTNLYTNGGEYVYNNTNEEYTGYYFQTSDGRYFTGRNPNDPPNQEIQIQEDSKLTDAEEGEIGSYNLSTSLYLVPEVYATAKSLNPNSTPPLPPTQVINLPTKENYKWGEFQRYFSSKNNEVRYTEIDENQYTKFIDKDPNVDYALYKVFQFPWLISGNRNEVINVKVIFKNMIQQQTKVKVRDNSGAKLVKCIKVLGGFKKKKAFTGDLIIVSIIKLRNKFKITSKVKKGELYKAVIIRTNKKNKKNKKKDGSYSYFFENSICLLNNQEKPIASRIIGPIPKQFKKTRLKLINIASGSFS